MGRYKYTRQQYKELRKKEFIGLTNVNKQGILMKIIEYENYDHITVQFEDGICKETSVQKFKKGSIRNENYDNVKYTPNKEKRLNEKKKNKEGYEMIIKEYKNSGNIIVEFCDQYHGQVHTSYESFTNGTVKNPNRKGKYGQITGNKYKTRDSDGKKIKEYSIWMAIIKRVYNLKSKAYENVQICEEWMYYPNFYEWIIKQPNYLKWKQSVNHEWAIDKDILSSRKNKIYSPATCCLVPSYINSAVVERNKNSSLPIGVNKISNKHYYYVDSKNNKNRYYETIEETKQAYLKYKSNNIKECAKYAYQNGDITDECYNALMNDNFLYR